MSFLYRSGWNWFFFGKSGIFTAKFFRDTVYYLLKSLDVFWGLEVLGCNIQMFQAKFSLLGVGFLVVIGSTIFGTCWPVDLIEWSPVPLIHLHLLIVMNRSIRLTLIFWSHGRAHYSSLNMNSFNNLFEYKIIILLTFMVKGTYMLQWRIGARLQS